MQRPARSLKSRALQLLAQRDQSRLELRRKLLRHARDARSSRGVGDALDVADQESAHAAATAAVGEVDQLLDWLEASGFLSDARFAESRVHARQSRFGMLRIQSELGRHDVALPAALAQSLQESELTRAEAVRERRFGAVPIDGTERARQQSFLLARGFAPEVVHRVMRRVARTGGTEHLEGAAESD